MTNNLYPTFVGKYRNANVFSEIVAEMRCEVLNFAQRKGTTSPNRDVVPFLIILQWLQLECYNYLLMNPKRPLHYSELFVHHFQDK